MTEKTTTIRVKSSVAKKLKYLGIEHECFIGDLVETLLVFAQHSIKNNRDARNLFELCLKAGDVLNDENMA